jgi:hypothetical protein
MAKGLLEEQYFADAFLFNSQTASVAAASAKGVTHD